MKKFKVLICTAFLVAFGSAGSTVFADFPNVKIKTTCNNGVCVSVICVNGRCVVMEFPELQADNKPYLDRDSSIRNV